VRLTLELSKSQIDHARLPCDCYRAGALRFLACPEAGLDRAEVSAAIPVRAGEHSVRWAGRGRSCLRGISWLIASFG
jgi:hypothetical protein